MLGAIIGDIVGSRWEFNPTNDYDFEWLSKENGFTDDTICTVAVADALLHERDFGESIHDWCNRYPHPMGGYGGRFAQWVRSENPKPYNSFGNGAAMRVSPVALWIIGQSTSFEDAVRKAVALGADADTLGAIVGSIAEAIWGIPESMKTEIMAYLPDEMKAVVKEFYEYIK